MNKIVEELGETVKEYLELLDDSIPIANYHMGSVSGLSQEIYNNRKELGLYTLDDIEIDEEKIMHILLDALAKLQNEHFTQQILARSSSRMCGKNYQVVDFLAKAIADKKPILIKDK